MAQTIIQQLETKLQLNDIKDVVVTPIEQDAEGRYVREFRIFGTPEDPDGANAPLVLTLRVLASTRAAIEVTTPVAQF